MREKTKTAIVSLIVVAMLMSVLPTTASASAPVEQNALNPKIDPYLHMMLADENPTGLNSIMSAGVEMISVFLETNSDPTARARLEANGVVVRSVIGNIMTANVPRNAINTVAEMPEVIYIEGDKPMQLQMDVSRPEIRAEDVQRAQYAPAGGTSTSVTGKGVIIGIIDTGIDFTHPDFCYEVGTEKRTRILKLWDQAPTNVKSTDLGSTPSGYNYGLEYDASNINYALSQPIQNVHDYVAQKDTNGHGTRVAGIAAGGGRGDAAYRGVAPEADIVFVKDAGDIETEENYVSWAGNVMDGMNYTYNVARDFNKTAVISMSLGTNWGPHDGTSLWEQMIDELSDKGAVIVCSAGNEGGRKTHMSGNTGGDTVSRTFTINGYLWDPCYHNIWYDKGNIITIQLVAPDGHKIPHVPLQPSQTWSESYLDYNIKIVCSSNYILVSMQGGSTEEEQQWEFLLSGSSDVQFDSWLTFGSRNPYAVTYDNPDETRTVTTPATAEKVIAVGSYNTKASPLSYHSDFSSSGPTRDGREQPVITAPGNYIVGPASKNAGFGWSGVYSEYTNINENKLAEGTSFAAPHVAGAIALMLQIDPSLNSTAIKTRLKETAKTDDYTGEIDWSEKWGYGKLNAIALSGIPYIDIDKGKWSVTDREVKLTINSVQDISSNLDNMRFANENTYEKQWYYRYQTIQSQHPVYPGNTMSFYLSYPDATRISVHFERIDIRENADFIYIKNSQGNVLTSFTGSYPTGVEWESSEADSINWIEVQMVIHSANSWSGYGFKIDWHGYYTPKWSSWETFPASNTRAWTLSPGYGEKTVHCQITDVMGNLYETSDDIQLVEHETSFDINSPADYTNSNIVGLGNLQSQGTPVEARFSNSPSPSWLYKSNPGFQNPRDYWWHLTKISPEIDPFPNGCSAGDTYTVELKGGSGPVQPPAEATHWRVNFALIHLRSGDTIRFEYFESTPKGDRWVTINPEYSGELDHSPMDSFDIPVTYGRVRLSFNSVNNNTQSPFAVTSWEWRNNNLYYSPYYENTWEVLMNDPYAPKVGISFEKIDLGAGDRLIVYHESGNLLGVLDGPVTMFNHFIHGENHEDIWVRLVSINPDTRGWGIRINGRYVYDMAWSGWYSWPSAPSNWDLSAFGGMAADGTKRVFMQTRYSDNGLGICFDDIILDMTPPAIGPPGVGDPITMLVTKQHLCVVGGTTIYYSHKLTGTSQVFTVRGTASNSGGSPLWKATASSAFGYTPLQVFAPVNSNFWEWSFTYDISHAVFGGGTISVSVFDLAGNINHVSFDYHEYNGGPNILLNFPTDNSYISGTTPYLTWFPASDEVVGISLEGYIVQVSNNIDFSALVVDVVEHSLGYKCPNLEDGTYYWRVLCTNNVGNIGESPIYRMIMDNTLPTAQIQTPAPGDAIEGIVEIIGTACDDNFHSYELGLGWGPSPTHFSLIATSSSCSIEAILGTLDTNRYTNGEHVLKLTAKDHSNQENSYSVPVMISNPAVIECGIITGMDGIYGSFFLNTPQMVSISIEDNVGNLIKNVYQNRWMIYSHYPSALIWDWTDSTGAPVGVGDYTIVIVSDKAPTVSMGVHVQAAPVVSLVSGDGTMLPEFSWTNTLPGNPRWHVYVNGNHHATTTTASAQVLCINEHQTIEIFGEYLDPVTGAVYATKPGSIEYTTPMARIHGNVSAPSGFWYRPSSGKHFVQFTATANANSPDSLLWKPRWIGSATVSHPSSSYPVTDTTIEYEIFIPSGLYTRVRASLNGPSQYMQAYWRTEYDIIDPATGNKLSTYDMFFDLQANNDYEINLEIEFRPPWSPGGACPYAAAWNGEEYVIDNNILGKSDYISDASPDITDHFRLTAGPELLNGVYPVAVGEPGNQYSIFDSFELLLVDHNPESNVIIDTDGNVRTYGELQPPISCTDKWGTDWLSGVSGHDRVYDGFEGDWLEMDFGFVESNIAKLVLNTDAKPGPGGGGDTIHIEDEIPGPIMIQALDEWGQWLNVSEVYPRHYWHYDMVDLSTYLIPGSPLKVRLEWVSYHKLAYVGLDIAEDCDIDIHTAPLIRAMDIGQNNITEILRHSDGIYADMSPGQYMTLDFGYVEQTKDHRDFILVSKGYYSVDKGKPMASVVPFPPEAYTHERIYFDARESGYSEEFITGYFYYFGDGTTSGWLTSPITSHAYSDDGTYVVTLIVKDARSPYRIGTTTTTVTILNRAPIPDIEVYQDVAIELRITGRKDNSVGIRIYEDGILIHSADVTRTPGQPDTVTLELDRYLGRVYEIELVYDAAHRGANPTWLEFSSGGVSLTHFKEFDTKDGFTQAITIDSSYLEDVVAANPTYSFDASGSYDIDGVIVSYEWDFGDNSTAQGIMAENTYTAPGTYLVTLTVTDDDGAVAKESLVIEIR